MKRIPLTECRTGSAAPPDSTACLPKHNQSGPNKGRSWFTSMTGLAAVLLLLAQLLVACGGSSSPTATPSAAATAQSTQVAQDQTAQSTTSRTTTATPTPTPTPVTLGKAEMADPAPDKSVKSETYGEVVVNQLGVILKEGKTRADAEKLAAKYGGKVIGEVEFANMYQLEVNATTEDELIGIVDGATLADGVEVAFANSRMYPLDSGCKACGPLSDPVYGEGENGRAYEVIGVANAWKIIKASGVKLNDVHVGVMDTALYKGSDELSGDSTISGDTTEDPETDDSGNVVDGGLNHGTMVAHVIGADSSNGGVAGVASALKGKLKVSVTNMYHAGSGFKEAVPDPKDPAKVQWSNGKAYTCGTFSEIVDQIKNGATVINCSFGPDHPEAANKPISEAYKVFLQNVAKKYPDVIFVAAAGNENGGLDGGNYSIGGHKLPNLITVGAIDNTGNRAGFSNYATGDGEVTISAPGVEVAMGVDTDGKTVKASGTSFSTPQVAAACAMIRSINPKLTASQIKDLLIKTATPGVTNGDTSTLIPEGMGAGVLSVDKAVLQAINDLRAANGESELNGEVLQKLASIDGSATSKGVDEFDVTATIEEANKDGADVTIDLMGEGMISGSSQQHLAKGESATWTVTTLEGRPAPSVRLSRLDTEASCDLQLEAIDLNGVWNGTMKITDGKVSGDVFIPDPLGEGEPTIITKEECESALKDAKGKANPIAMDFKASSPTAGVMVIVSGDSEGEQTPIPYAFDGKKVVMDTAQEGATIHIEGTVTATDSEYTMEGVMKVNSQSGEDLILNLTISFKVTKPKTATP